MNTKTTTVISIAEDFSRFPSGRYLADGEFTGEKFRQEILVPALNNNGVVQVVFDGIAGAGSSFLEEAFGGLIRKEGMNKEFLDTHLQLSNKDKELDSFVRMAKFFIERANDKFA